MNTLRTLCQVLLFSILSSGCGPTVDGKLTTIDLRVSSSGECAIGEHRVSCSDLGAYIVQHYDSDEVDVRLHVDRSVKYDQIGRVLASLQSSRIVRVGFANSKPGT